MVDVAQERRLGELVRQNGREAVELVGVRALERELVLALGQRAADADRRWAPAGTPRMPGTWCELGHELGDDLAVRSAVRSVRGLSRMNTMPLFAPPMLPRAPTLDMNLIDVRVLAE